MYVSVYTYVYTYIYIYVYKNKDGLHPPRKILPVICVDIALTVDGTGRGRDGVAGGALDGGLCTAIRTLTGAVRGRGVSVSPWK